MQEEDKHIVTEVQVQGEGYGKDEASFVSETTEITSFTGENQKAASTIGDNEEERRNSTNNSRRDEGRQNMMSAILQAPKTSKTRASWSSASATGLPAKTIASIEKEEEIRRHDEQLRILLESETASIVEKEPNPFERETMLLARYLESTGKNPLAAEAAAHAFVADLDSNEELSIQEKSHSGSAAESSEYPQSILFSGPYRRLSDMDNSASTTATNTTTSINRTTRLKRSEASNKRLQGRTEKMGALIRSMSSGKGLDDSEQANMESQSESSDNLVPGAFQARGRAYGGLPSWSFNQSTSSVPIRPQRHASRRISSDEIAMIRNNGESAEEPDDDVEDARRYTESHQGRNIVSSVVTRLSNHSNQSNRSEETTQPEMEHIEILEAKAITVSDDDHEQPVFLATEIESTSTKLYKDKRFWKAVALFSLLMCILVSFFVARDRRSRSSNTRRDTSAPSMSPTLSPTVNSDDLQIVLERFSKKEDLEQIGSPQRKALLWLANKDIVPIEPEDPLFPQRYALIVVFYATQPGNGLWLQQGDWLSSSSHECDWGEAIYCDPEITVASKNVKILNLAKNGLAGTLPPEIGLLTDLEQLILSHNTIQGTIPTNIGALSLLTNFDLSMNQFSGVIPDKIGNFKFLRYLGLSDNTLSGIIPDSMYSLSQLKSLDLGQNELIGTLSEDVKHLKFLHTLRLSNNKLSGQLPTTLSELEDINILVLDNNAFTGNMPDVEAFAFRLEILSIPNNSFEGTIVLRFNNSIKDAANFDFDVQKLRLRVVDISNNKISGTLSPLISYLHTLEDFDISGNSFSGTIFPTLSYMNNLKTFRVSNNSLTGSLPQFSSDQRIQQIDTKGNDLSHDITDLALNQNQLKVLSISGRCGPSIPAQISNMTNLVFLDASNCNLGGTLPRSIGQMTQLAQLYLEGNKLSGPIPREFGNMENLRNLSLANNQLTGPIPPDLSRLQDLQQCHLGGNSLEGPVPEEICSLDISQLEVDSNVQCSCCIGDN